MPKKTPPSLHWDSYHLPDQELYTITGWSSSIQSSPRQRPTNLCRTMPIRATSKPTPKLTPKARDPPKTAGGKRKRQAEDRVYYKTERKRREQLVSRQSRGSRQLSSQRHKFNYSFFNFPTGQCFKRIQSQTVKRSKKPNNQMLTIEPIRPAQERTTEKRLTFQMFPGRMRVLQIDQRKEWKKGRLFDLKELMATQSTKKKHPASINIVTLG